MSHYSTFAAAALAMFVCVQANAGLIIDADGSMGLQPEWVRVFVDEFHQDGRPTGWWIRDGELPPYIGPGTSLATFSARKYFWVPRTAPSFYLESIGDAFPKPDLGDRGLTFHTLDVEALAGANEVTVAPSNVPGRFDYAYTGGSRTVNLTVLPRVPEPASWALAVVGAALLLQMRHRLS